jgi:ADP-ribosylglycohydrolase
LRKLGTDQVTLTPTIYMEALRYSISEGGDTDTNAAIVGGLIGAAIGITHINKDLVLKHLSLRTDLKNTPARVEQRMKELCPGLFAPQLLNKIFILAPTILAFPPVAAPKPMAEFDSEVEAFLPQGTL